MTIAITKYNRAVQGSELYSISLALTMNIRDKKRLIVLNPVKIREKSMESFVVNEKGCNFASAFGNKRGAARATARDKRAH